MVREKVKAKKARHSPKQVQFKCFVFVVQNVFLCCHVLCTKFFNASTFQSTSLKNRRETSA